jgi:hypothetical protein
LELSVTVHHKRTLTNNPFIDGFAVHYQKRRVGHRFDSYAISGVFSWTAQFVSYH